MNQRTPEKKQKQLPSLQAPKKIRNCTHNCNDKELNPIKRQLYFSGNEQEKKKIGFSI